MAKQLGIDLTGSYTLVKTEGADGMLLDMGVGASSPHPAKSARSLHCKGAPVAAPLQRRRPAARQPALLQLPPLHSLAPLSCTSTS